MYVYARVCAILVLFINIFKFIILNILEIIKIHISVLDI